MTSATRDFGVYGLRVRSDIDLPGWPALEVDNPPDVFIRQEPCSTPDLEGAPYSARSVVEAGELKLVVLGVGSYAASGGTLIRVQPAPRAKAEDLRLYLMGALVGAILHQRGVFPLHASCVALNGLSVAFAGQSGAGKSTLVAALVRRGGAFVTDDISVMAPSSGNGIGVLPGAARVKLDEIGLGRLSGSVFDLEPAGGTRGKYHLPMDSSAEWMTPVPLGRIYLLTDGEGPPRLEQLTGLHAVSALVDETYFLGYAVNLGLTSQVFRLAATVARILPVSRLIRPRGLEHLQTVVELIERDGNFPQG
ncbi:MAG: hypothetical protein ACR2G6_14595 [Gemmatimonadaceae bacterium]